MGTVYACQNGQKEAVSAPTQPVTYTNRIAGILRQHCVKCHQPGGAGPFSLLDYRQAARKSKTIAKVTREGYMPPWPADTQYTRFLHQPRISPAEIKAIQNWAKNGAPYGDSLPLPPAPPLRKRRIAQKPDTSLGYLQRVQVPGDNTDRFFALKIPLELKEPTYLRALEFVPENPQLVHHLNGHLVSFSPDKMPNLYQGQAVIEHDSIPPRQLAYQMGFQQSDGSFPRLTPSVVNYLPGVGGTLYPEGIGGWPLGRKSALYINDLHFGPSPIAASDSSYFNLYFTKRPPQRPVYELHLGTFGKAPVEPPLEIEAGETKDFTIRYHLDRKISVLTVNPHMHLLGRRFKAYALDPFGDTIPLIRIKDWDFRWQFFYTYPQPVILPAGSEIRVEAHYDNTVNNPYNPFDPPRALSKVHRSMRTTDEMLQFFINYLPYQAGDENLDLAAPWRENKKVE